MSATASDPFFWNDWQGDPCLRACSFAAQGLWMRLLCLAAESTEKGFVLIAGRVPTTDDIVRIGGGTPDEIDRLIEELKRWNVCSIDRRGAIYSRRMVRAENKRRASSSGGSKGGPKTAELGLGIHATPPVDNPPDGPMLPSSTDNVDARQPHRREGARGGSRREQAPSTTNGANSEIRSTRTPTRGLTRHPKEDPLPSPVRKDITRGTPGDDALASSGVPPPVASMTSQGFDEWVAACRSSIPRRWSRAHALRRWLALPLTPVADMIAAWQSYVASVQAERERTKMPMLLRFPENWMRERVYQNFLDDIADEANRLANLKAKRETALKAMGKGDLLVAKLGTAKFDALFLGSRLVETDDGFVVVAASDFCARRIRDDFAAMRALTTILDKPFSVTVEPNTTPERITR